MTNQMELPGMPEESPLGQAAQRFVGEKETIAAAKLRLGDIEEDILVEMKKANLPKFKVSAGGENYEFELVPGHDALRCAKITRTKKAGEKTEGGEEQPTNSSAAAEPAVA